MQIIFKAPYIIKYYRDEQNNRKIDRVHTDQFPPYFYVKKGTEVPSDPRILRVEASTKKSIFGDELIKIIVKEVYDVVKLRMLFYETWEADIRFTDRYYIDCVKEIPRENLRKGYYDLETSDMPSTQMDDKEINTIGIWDNYTDKYYTFIITGVEKTEEKEGHIIYHCVNEYQVLNKFIDHVKDFDYDMLIAHNSSRFDEPVLIGRIQKLSIMNYGRMSSVGTVKRDNLFGEWRCEIGGRILFDFLGAKTNFGIKGGIRGLLDGRDITVKGPDGEDKIVRIKRWSLEYLAQFVGMKKGEYKKVQTIEDMITYNKQDVAIMVALDKFFNVTEYYHNMQILIGCDYHNTYFNTLMIDNFLLKRYSYIAFPTKPERGKFDNDETIKGADVTEPKQGLYEKIDVIDQTSLYPSIVVSYNMSPETVDPEGDIIVGNGVKFTSKKVGIIADAVQFLLDIRLKYKKLAKTETDPYKAQMADLLQNGYKTLLVSFYGALLYKGFRLYQHDVAESIPYVGRIIKVEHVKPLCEAHGYEIVLGDTDSSGLHPIANNAAEINQLVDIINKSYDDYAKEHGIKKHIFHIELDKTYSPIIISDVKKRYVGYLIKNGKKIYKATGFESVRRDASVITEVMQESVFKMILDGKNRTEITAWVDQLKVDIKNKVYLMEWLMLPKGFNKAFDKFKTDSPWVRAARYSNTNLGTKFDQYSELGIFYIKSVPEKKPYTDVVAVDNTTLPILDGFIIDWDIQLDKTIDSKFQNILDMMGWGKTKQVKLEIFKSNDDNNKFVPSGQMKLFSYK
ncbi:MAG: DNA polymerase domain-containing protein [Candidatus Methanoperedens sp.]